MKKQLITGLVGVCLISVGSLVLAAPSPNASANATEKSANAGQGKNNSGNRSPKAVEKSSNAGGGGNPKVQIAHCGCNYDGSGLEWKHIKVSTKAKGHLRHKVDSSASCIYLDEEVTYLRGGEDCRISDEPLDNIGGLENCEPVPEIQTNCEAELEPVVDEPGEEV